ncbi:MAG: hypothetical protein J4203_06115 [Candidatus Diapherotrites archaeon]|uniref:Uncharacterized protein n=1 Tax=Candidatus Iainarchaeum sp. TaxID=3101447 RepID=A0A8T4LFU6_9ARCH|nr:hypothetical protein [Candidatus Diapherotrites archaeon]
MAKPSEDRFFLLLLVAVLGRLLLLPLPSIKPILPIIVFTALSLGLDQGLLMAFLGFFLSNLVIDGISGYGFGSWTIYQVLGGALAAYTATLVAGRRPVTSMDLVNATLAGTLVFELTINFGSAGGLDIEYFLGSLPFALAHLAGNLVFAVLLSGFLPKTSH